MIGGEFLAGVRGLEGAEGSVLSGRCSLGGGFEMRRVSVYLYSYRDVKCHQMFMSLQCRPYKRSKLLHAQVHQFEKWRERKSYLLQYTVIVTIKMMNLYLYITISETHLKC